MYNEIETHPTLAVNNQPELRIGTADYGGVGLTMPVDDYLNSLNGDEKTDIASCFLKCTTSAIWYYKQYNVNSEVPTILANTLISIKATSSAKNQIIISRGMIEHLKACHPPEHLTNFQLTQNQWTDLCIFWVIAHECTHLARGHFEMKRDGISTHHGYEYDADCLATAALYRYICANYLQNFPSYSREAKVISLNVAYWCITMLPDYDVASPAETHPSWEDRLIYIHYKLIHIQVPNINDGITKQAFDEIQFITKSLCEIDMEYSKKIGLPREEWKITKWAEKYFAGKPILKPIICQWDAAIPYLPKYSKCFMDRPNYRPRFGHPANVSFGRIPKAPSIR